MSVLTFRRRARAAVVLAAGAALALSACGSSAGTSPGKPSGAGSYDDVVSAGPVASKQAIESNSWARAVRERGYLRVGGVDNIPLFSLKGLDSERLEGFDAGISQLLARYITGKKDLDGLTKLTVVTADTREALLQNGSIDVAVATYSITPERAEKVAFAGPYFQSGLAIMVKKGDTSITSVEDLAGKKVATQSGSTAPLALRKAVPDAKLVLFREDAQGVAAVQQGRVDAFVLDQSILLGKAQENKAVEVVGGNPFTVEAYGIGVAKDGPGKAFIDEFLRTIEKDGSWAKLWKATIGTVTTGDAPAPPQIGSAEGS
jgi:glutamate transport system substrate-binding protein